MSTQIKCRRCLKPSITLVMALWKKGPQGFRRYAVCEKCAEEIKAEQEAPKPQASGGIVS